MIYELLFQYIHHFHFFYFIFVQFEQFQYIFFHRNIYTFNIEKKEIIISFFNIFNFYKIINKKFISYFS